MPSKQSVIKKLQKKAGNFWKSYAKKRDKVCFLCGSDQVLQVHHIFSRTIKRLFLDTENGICLCRRCHMAVTWQDSAKETLRRKLIAKDKAMYDRLYEQSLDKMPFLEIKSIAWLENQIRILEELNGETTQGVIRKKGERYANFKA
jgi:hypothetical protein